MRKALTRFVDWFVSPEDKTLAVELRKARFFVITLFLIALSTGINIVYFAQDLQRFGDAALGSAIVSLVVVTLIFLYRHFGNRGLFANIFNLISMGMIMVLIYRESGGIYSSDLAYLMLSSAWIFLIAGKRSGLFWFSVSFAAVIVYYVLAVNNNQQFLDTLLKLPPDYNLMNYVIATWYLYFIVAMHQKNNDTYLGEINEQKHIIEEKNKEILDSISYAKRLQEAILPPLEHVREVFNDFFILYKPKDIVAGDFYWMERRDHHVFFAVADCTGHGVPGAMVSVVCSNALNHAVREFKLNDPGAILDKVSDLVQQTFEKSKSDVNDGMDISLLVMDTLKREIQWAGANNSLWLVRDGKFTETKANKQPIGRHEGRKPFTTHTFTVETGDVAYLFTDGFADQFGGPKGKKFKYKQLMKTIGEGAHLPAQKQEEMLEQKFAAWKGPLEQVDDVCVAGVRFN